MGKKKVSIKERIPKSAPKEAKDSKKSNKQQVAAPVAKKEIKDQSEDVEMIDPKDEEGKEEKDSSDEEEEVEEEIEEEEEEEEPKVQTEYDAYSEEERKLLAMDEETLEDTTFAELDLDSRLLQALSLIKLYKPTPIQVKAIPLALGLKKDIIGRAKTGSGKTVAYAIPIVESILQESVKSQSETSSTHKGAVGNRAIILVPSRELADQVAKLFKSLTIFADKLVGVVNVSSQQSSSATATTSSENIMASLLATKPAIIVGTPAKVLAHIQSGSIDASAISYLVIDEADLILSYGFREDLDALAQLLPVKKTIQTWLMSATISEDINDIKAAFCRKNLAVLRLEDNVGEAGGASSNKLLQYYVKTSEIDKFLLIYVIFKLRLIRGKTLIFVNNIERCYQLKLFLEQFGIKSIVLNSELPIASRLHIVEEFNRNVYDLLIATDENTHYMEDGEKDEEEEKEEEQEQEEGKETQKKRRRNKKSKFSSDKEYSVSRGVDFRNVACVLNFDLPTSATVYTHRIGRTARANKSGMALSFVVPRKDWRKKEYRTASLDTAKKDEKVLARVMKHQEKKRAKALKRLGLDEEQIASSSGVPEGYSENDAAVIIQPYVFDMKQMESFRYRMEGAFRAVTKMAVREARIKEIRQELLTSEKLKRHFEENPEDLAFLRHDKELHAAKVQPHLKRVPQYLLPSQARGGLNTLQPQSQQQQQQYVSARKNNSNRIKKQQRQQKKKSIGGRKGGDPLRSFRR
ncbi:uncharacterized protein SAPINGB_P006090 [Magnusiomyces paraingens]|uniref:ATP-dependent RNA helicase DBP9 n=1 Tax=Magnusiomyces paraingens TaxID=2606893 RepID=A0A5E8CAC7_9ASCO|nr:uncharacterized protein SAPINGB_P006090 [Saprochaete ingens]VVT58206.1 unnamed protein product [Saprochaete ingens]